jgi:antitoxin ParD1/3/4
MTVKTLISLTDDQNAFARALVARGRYPSVSAVLQHGLEVLRRDDETHSAQVQALQALIDQRRSEPFVSLEESAEEFLAAVDCEG